MPIEPPRLDDRTFQKLVDEAKRRINVLCPDWTDHNVSDPGITLIELFAHMTEQILYRLNRTPEKNYLAFLKLVGLRLNPAVPATGEVLFTFTNPLSPGDAPFDIPAQREVATRDHDEARAVVFTTDRKVTVYPPALRVALSAPDLNKKDEVDWTDVSTAARAGQPLVNVLPLEPVAGTRPALLLGFDADLSGHQLSVTLDTKDRTSRARWRWEVLLGSPGQPDWKACEWDMSAPGADHGVAASLHLSRPCAPRTFKSLSAKTWIRLVGSSPDVKSATAGGQPATDRWSFTVGVTVPGISASVTQSQHVVDRGEELGVSDGRPGQSFRLTLGPVLPPLPPDNAAPPAAEHGPWNAWELIPNFVQVVDAKGHPFTDAAGNPLAWTLQPDFGASGPDDRHVVFDPAAGAVTFGPRVGSRQFGAIPPENARVRVDSYRIGGGVRGNVGAGRVNTLWTNIKNVRQVANWNPMLGGRDVESVGEAMVRAPAFSGWAPARLRPRITSTGRARSPA